MHFENPDEKFFALIDLLKLNLNVLKSFKLANQVSFRK